MHVCADGFKLSKERQENMKWSREMKAAKMVHTRLIRMKLHIHVRAKVTWERYIVLAVG